MSVLPVSYTHLDVYKRQRVQTHTAPLSLHMSCDAVCVLGVSASARLALTPARTLVRRTHVRSRCTHMLRCFNRGNHSSKILQLEYVRNGQIQPGLNLL